MSVCLCAKFDQFLPVRSYFDTKHPVNLFHIATFPSPTFGPLFAFHCPLFFTKNNNLECRDVLKTVTVTSGVCVCVCVSEPGRSTLNVLNYKYKYFPSRKYLSTSTLLFGEMYLSTFRVLSKCT